MFFSTKHIVKKITSSEKNIYLTFDDGPCELTIDVLNVLEKFNAKATFFVIGTKADLHPQIIEKTLNSGHAIYSHSIDHDYSNYFKSDNTISVWIENSLNHLEKLIGKKTVFFRPPAGIITPPLLRATAQKNIQIILWNTRFYDSVWALTQAKVSKYLRRVKAGDIILLHDAQKTKNEKVFLTSLEYLLKELANKNYQFCSL